jgi:ABC-type uncharacterized transport system ATPase subunit
LVAGTVERVYLLEQGRVVREGTLDALGGAEGLAALYLGVKGVAGTQRDKEPHQKTATS